MSTPFEERKYEEERLFRRLTRIETHLKNEFDLIGQRVSWLLATNAFLFTALMLNINHLNDEHAPYTLTIKYASILLAILGIGSSFLTFLSILGAYIVVHKVKKTRKHVEADAATQFQHDLIGVHNEDCPHWMGHIAPFLLPWLLIVVWMLILILR